MKVSLDMIVEGYHVLVRGNRTRAVRYRMGDASCAAVYCLPGLGEYLYVAVTIGPDLVWQAGVNKAHTEGKARSVEQAAETIARFWLEHREDDSGSISRKDAPFMKILAGDTLEPLPSDPPRLTRADFETLRRKQRLVLRDGRECGNISLSSSRCADGSGRR